MNFTQEREKSLALLLSIVDLGGGGTKKQVLDNIEGRGYISFDDRDLEMKTNRSELVWRNNLAYISSTLSI